MGNFCIPCALGGDNSVRFNANVSTVTVEGRVQSELPKGRFCQ